MQHFRRLVPASLRNRSALDRAFTLVELLVVAGIITLVSGIVLANNSRFGGVIVLENLAYDIGLSIRQAQVYGISVARFGASTYSAGYGVHIDLSSPATYVLFADALTENGLYDCPSPGSESCELVQASTLNQSYRIADLCITPPSGIETCGTTSRIDILFKRPEPDAWVSANDNPCTLNNAACQSRVRIVVASPRGDTMNIVVDANGQISVRKGTTQ